MGRGKGWLGAGVCKDTNNEKLCLVYSIVSPVLGPVASCCVGLVLLMNSRRDLGRLPVMIFPQELTSEYIPRLILLLDFPPGWGIQTHAPSYGHPS